MTTTDREEPGEAIRPPRRGRAVGVGRLAAREVGGVPVLGAALAVLLVAAVALALALVPPATPPSAGPPANGVVPPAATTRAPGPRPPADLFPTGTTQGAITLSWRAPRPLPVGYRVYRATGHFAPYAIVGTVNAPDITSFTDDQGLLPGATYSYTVTAFDGQSESAPVGPVVAVLLPGAQPTPMSTTPAQPVGPLPTLAPIPPRTLTAIARLPQPVGTPFAPPGASTTPGIAPVVSPVASIPAIATPAPLPTVAAPAALPTVATPAPLPTVGGVTAAPSPTVVALATPTVLAGGVTPPPAPTLLPASTPVSVAPTRRP